MNCNRISMGQVASGTLPRFRDEATRWAGAVTKPVLAPRDALSSPAARLRDVRTSPATTLPPQRDAV